MKKLKEKYCQIQGSEEFFSVPRRPRKLTVYWNRCYKSVPLRQGAFLGGGGQIRPGQGKDRTKWWGAMTQD